MTKYPECPMCEPGTCPGGAHYNALMEEGIRTREQWEALSKTKKETPDAPTKT